MFALFQDDSITQATSRVSENLSEFNPFSAMEMVSSAAAHMTYPWQGRHWAASFSLVSQGKHTDTTIPVSATSSQPAILQTSVEQSPQVSRTRTNQERRINPVSGFLFHFTVGSAGFYWNCVSKTEDGPDL